MRVQITVTQKTQRGELFLKFDRFKNAKDSKLVIDAGNCLFENMYMNFSNIDELETTTDDEGLIKLNERT